jgi:hypothetical protein
MLGWLFDLSRFMMGDRSINNLVTVFDKGIKIVIIAG